MSAHKIITVSKTGTIGYYNPPQTNPYKSLRTAPPDTTSNTLPLLTHQKSSIHHPATKSRVPTSPITALTTHAPLLITGNSEGFVNIHAHPTANPTTVSLHVNAVTELRVCDSAEILLSSGIDGFVHITRLSQPSAPFSSLRHPLPVTAFVLGYSSSTARVVTASADRCTRVWHLASARLLTTLRHATRVIALAMDTGEDFWWGGADGSIGKVTIAELPVGGVVQGSPFVKRGTPVSALAISPEGAIVGFEDGVVQIFDGRTNVLIRNFGGGAPIVRLFVDYEEDGDKFDARSMEDGAVVVGTGCRKDAWEFVMDLAEDAFRENEEVVAVDSDDRVKGLEEEIRKLKKRNRELEDAGLRLIKLVEQDG